MRPNGWFRSRVYRLVSSAWFDHVIIGVILCNVITMFMERTNMSTVRHGGWGGVK